MSKQKKETIFSVLDEDLEAALRAINMYDVLLEGKLECSQCGKSLNTANLMTIFSPKKNLYKFSCNDSLCFQTLMESSK